MLGLGDYGSSDDEDASGAQHDKTKITAEAAPPPKSATEQTTNGEAQRANETSDTAAQPATTPSADTKTAPDAAPGPALPSTVEDAPADRPTPGPFAPPAAVSGDANGAASASQSPYSASRAIVRNLTMPRVPNFDIPPSPPGSPPAKATTQFAHFLEIKKKGHHFNARLENSSALRNPSLLQKLRGFAGIDDEAQYATTLPPDVAVPTSFPAWAYGEQLGKSQEDIMRKREEEQRKTQREAVEFVPASSAGSSGLGIGDGRGTSLAERVKAGLSRENSRSPMVSEGNKRRDGDRRDRDYDERRKRSRFDR